MYLDIYYMIDENDGKHKEEHVNGFRVHPWKSWNSFKAFYQRSFQRITRLMREYFSWYNFLAYTVEMSKCRANSSFDVFTSRMSVMDGDANEV